MAADKGATKPLVMDGRKDGRKDGRTELKQYIPLLFEAGVIKIRISENNERKGEIARDDNFVFLLNIYIFFLYRINKRSSIFTTSKIVVCDLLQLQNNPKFVVWFSVRIHRNRIDP